MLATSNYGLTKAQLFDRHLKGELFSYWDDMVASQEALGQAQAESYALSARICELQQ